METTNSTFVPTSNETNDLYEDVPSMMTLEVSPTYKEYELNIMAICTASCRSGMAVYYDSFLSLIADKSSPGDANKGIDTIIEKLSPDLVIIAGGSIQLLKFLEKRFAFNIRDIHKNCRDINDISDAAFTLVIVPNVWFSISCGETQLIESEWVINKGFKDPEQRMIFVYSKVKKSVDVCAIRSISAIYRFLKYTHSRHNGKPAIKISESQTQSSINQIINPSQLTQSTRQLDNDEDLGERYMPILSVNYIDPGPVVSIDKLTIQTLGISTSTGSKRNHMNSDDLLSQATPTLHSLLNECHSSQGRKTLLNMMAWPTRNLEELHYRFETVDFFTRQENKLFKEQLSIQLKNMHPLSRILSKLSLSVGSFKELSIVYKSLWAYLAILDLIKSNDSGELYIFKRILDLDSPALRLSIDSIINVIDFEASKREQHVQVCIGIDEDVDEKREVAKNLARFCEEVGAAETLKYKNIIGKTCWVQYVPRLGFLESVNYSSKAELDRIMLNNEFDVVLHTETAVYFKTKKMDELDIDAGDVACDLIDVQETVLINLQSEVVQHTDLILKILEVCGELDCLISFATVSSQHNYIRPDLTDADTEIDIKDARHPLINNSVSNHVQFLKRGDDNLKVMIITGPNSCGKTTYMKMVCLIVYMAHIGCFVPASYAKIPLVDAIFTRMHSANSISTGLSSFATDLNQINYALGRATNRSLIAIDEFGKGTQAEDGFHLLKGLVAYFAVRGSLSPYVMVATHYNRLVDHLTSYIAALSCKTFKVCRDRTEDTIVYEYKMIDGISESSLADDVAIKAGVPQVIIERAKEVRQCISNSRPIQPRAPRAA